MPSLAALTHAPWSSSKVKCALRCAQEYHFRYVDKIPEPEVGPEMRLGKAVHAALEAVLADQTPVDVGEALATARRELPEEEQARFDAMAPAIGKFRERIEAFRARRRVREKWIEHKLAVREDLAPTEFIARDAFFRGVLDVGFLFDEDVLAVVDHKTGMRGEPGWYADQLEGYATLALAHHAGLKRIWLGVHFVSDASMEWTPVVAAEDVRVRFMPRLVEQIERAAAHVARGAIPNVTGYCKRCGYKAICPAMREQALAEAAAGEQP